MGRELLLSCRDIGKAFGTRILFEGLSLALYEGDRVGLVGPNGSGKSTLLKILAGLEPADAGSRTVRGGVRVGYVAQDPELPSGVTVEEALADAARSHEEAERPRRIALALGRAGFGDRDARVDQLSGGWRKRLAIARALLAEPDVLLMDEPTNHLDVEAILWLEEILPEAARAVVLVSHDRYVLEHVATRVVELGRAYPGGAFAVDGGYSEFLARRDDLLRGQAAYEESLANTVRREIAWLRQGAKARSTKAKGRIQEAERLEAELGEARARSASATVDIAFASSGRRTRRLLVAQGVAKTLGGRALFSGLDLALAPGVRIGVIGPNASGKTTLLGLLDGTIPPDAGTVERAEGLRLVHLRQDRAGLDPEQPLRRALAPQGDTVTWQGRSMHVAAWARRFAFSPEQLDGPVGRLSGGEQARVLIARLMVEAADVLLLDEPTNDLDIATLEVLEERLVEFPGGLVLVTHDRLMLERVCTQILALDGQGRVGVFADYAQWSAARARPARRPQRDSPPPGRQPAARERTRSKRLSYLEQREWDGMEQAILEAEAVAEECRKRAEDPAIASDPVALQARYAELEAARSAVEALYARWAELEAKQR